MKSLMISSMTRNQDDIESKTTTLSKIEQVSETTTSSKAQNAQIIKTSSERDTTSNEDLNVNVQSNEYERLLTARKKIEQIKEIQLLREQKDQEWSITFILSLHSKNLERIHVETTSISVRNLIMKHEKYLNIIKFEIYKNNNSQELNIFIKVCQMMFDVRFVIYENDLHRINFVKSLLSNNVSEFDWVWQKYRLRLDETAKSTSFWKQFCDFLREQISLIKLRITIVEQKIKLLHQRNNQSIAQLIAYFEALKEQWFEIISNSLRASNFLLVLHEYLRKKIVRKNVDVASRKIVDETVRQMKAVKTKSQFKLQNKSDHKQSKEQFANNKRSRNDQQNETQLMIIVTANSNQKKTRSTKNLSHIICYTCDKSRHYKSQCRSDDIDKQSRKDRNRST